MTDTTRVQDARRISGLLPGGDLVDHPGYEQTTVVWSPVSGTTLHLTVHTNGRLSMSACGATEASVEAFLKALASDLTTHDLDPAGGQR